MRDSSLVALLIGGIAVVGSNALLLAPILADVGAGIGAGPAEVARAMTAYGAATAVGALTLGPLVDRLGPAAALRRGTALLMLALILTGLATTAWMLAIGQAVAGLGAGLVLPATYALAGLTATPGQEGRRLGRVLTGWSVAMVAGVPLAGLVADHLGWRACYAVLALATGGCLALQQRLASPSAGATSPRVPIATLLHRPDIVRLLAVCLLFMIGFYATYAFLGEHVRQAFGLGAGGASLLVLAYGAGFGLGQALDPWLGRIGAARALPAVLAVLALIFAGMAAGAHQLPVLAALVLLWGVVNHAGLTLIVLLLGEAAPSGARGAVLGLNSAVTYAGVVVGTGAASFVYPATGFVGTALACALVLAVAAVTALPRSAAASPRGLDRSGRSRQAS